MVRSCAKAARDLSDMAKHAYFVTAVLGMATRQPGKETTLIEWSRYSDATRTCKFFRSSIKRKSSLTLMGLSCLLGETTDCHTPPPFTHSSVRTPIIRLAADQLQTSPQLPDQVTCCEGEPRAHFFRPLHWLHWLVTRWSITIALSLLRKRKRKSKQNPS
jgi:hypothetical protein